MEMPEQEKAEMDLDEFETQTRVFISLTTAFCAQEINKGPTPLTPSYQALAHTVTSLRESVNGMLALIRALR